jgi:pre-mRNA-processing factor SLU7
LRIREDTAKYLRNLDPNSAYYDPKTRSMRKNPYEGNGKKDDEVEFAGDNFVRISGDTVSHAQSQMFSWEAGRKGMLFRFFRFYIFPVFLIEKLI